MRSYCAISECCAWLGSARCSQYLVEPLFRNARRIALALCSDITYMQGVLQAMTYPTDDIKSTTIQMRVSDEFLRLVDEWRRQQPDLPSRSEAIRRLVASGVKTHSRKGKAK
jgi:hypothetical protein